MIEIIKADDKHLGTIQNIAHTTWPQTFKNILSNEQIKYMLDLMYNLSSLKAQINEKRHQFILAKEDHEYVGFASLETNFNNSNQTKIHKLYILPEYQGKGVGRLVIERIKEAAIQVQNNYLTLNVNRKNPAVNFYLKSGFKIIREENIPIGNNFYMEDYVMQMKINEYKSIN